MVVIGIPLEDPRADLDKCDAGAVVGIHIGVDLEDKAGEVGLLRSHDPLLCLSGSGRGGDADKGVEHLLDAEVIER